jgi:hypothetical protein
MPRNPYDAHLCAQDPDGFALGFERAASWVTVAHPQRAALVHHAIATSTNRPWPDTAARIGFRPNAYVEGLALGIYGLKALEGIGG